MLRALTVLVLVSSVAHAGPPTAPVVGGTPAPEGRWPDVVAVVGAAGTCTGTLIADDVVLTAGHCIDLEPTEIITNTVDAGHPYPGVHIAVKWARAYPSWWDRYDIGVLMLEHAAWPAPRTIASACHANRALADGALLHVVGFGLTTPDASDDNTRLHEATLPVIDPFCEGAPGCNAAVAPKGEIAAGGRGVDSCFGDSGGPALLDTPDGPVLVGVVSRGLAVPGQPCGNGGIYARVDKVVAWIQQVTNRTLRRTTCDGRADAAGAIVDEPEDIGGCAAGGRSGAAMMLLIVALARRRRARACYNSPPWPRSR